MASPRPISRVQDSTRTVALHDLKGKVVVLNFWATWCPPCVDEMPSLVQMQSRLKDKGVTVLAVSVDVDENAYKKFLKDHDVDLLAVRDPNQKSNALYGTFKFPETYVIDRDRQGAAQVHRAGGLDAAGDCVVLEQDVVSIRPPELKNTETQSHRENCYSQCFCDSVFIDLQPHIPQAQRIA